MNLSEWGRKVAGWQAEQSVLPADANTVMSGTPQQTHS